MRKYVNPAAVTMFPGPNPANPGRPGKPKHDELDEEADIDPLFDEEDELLENFEEDDEYEINDKRMKSHIKDICDYMSSSL
ncbi:MAG TPA: hypothetical protein VF868_04635 [Bacteroidia bacterium]|jgi:hypothetical protein